MTNGDFVWGNEFYSKTVIVEFSKIELQIRLPSPTRLAISQRSSARKSWSLLISDVHHPISSLLKYMVSSFSYDRENPPRNLKLEALPPHLVGYANDEEEEETFSKMRAEALAEAIIEDCEVKEVKRIILISCGMCGNEGEMEVVLPRNFIVS